MEMLNTQVAKHRHGSGPHTHNKHTSANTHVCMCIYVCVCVRLPFTSLSDSLSAAITPFTSGPLLLPVPPALVSAQSYGSVEAVCVCVL